MSAKITCKYSKSHKIYIAVVSDDAGALEACGKTKEAALRNLIQRLWKGWARDAGHLDQIEALREALERIACRFADGYPIKQQDLVCELLLNRDIAREALRKK